MVELPRRPVDAQPAAGPHHPDPVDDLLGRQARHGRAAQRHPMSTVDPSAGDLVRVDLGTTGGRVALTPNPAGIRQIFFTALAEFSCLPPKCRR